MTRFRFAWAVVLVAAFATVAAAADPFDGTWRLNTAKSKYDPGPAPEKVNENTRETKTTKGGSPVSESRAVVSADGKTLTITGAGLNPKGEKNTFTAVYDKQ
jgi:hypothetical protein